MIRWDDFDHVNRRVPRRRSRLCDDSPVQKPVTVPIPSIAALIEDLPCTWCNAAPGEPCRGCLTPHIERQDAAHDLRDRMLGR